MEPNPYGLKSGRDSYLSRFESAKIVINGSIIEMGSELWKQQLSQLVFSLRVNVENKSFKQLRKKIYPAKSSKN